MKKLKVGIIGCGRIGSLLENDPLRDKPCTHAGGFNALPSTQIVAGCDLNQERLDQFGKRWDVDALYTNYREFLKQESLDIVSIAAWTRAHSKLALACTKADIKGVLCEKPIALTVKEGARMVRAFRKHSIPLVINHERRWEPFYTLAHKLVQQGKIGEIRTIVGNTLSGPPGKGRVDQFGGGPMFHDGTHLLDLLVFFGGPVAWVSGHENRPHGKQHIEETATAMLQFKNGALGFVEGGGGRRYFNFELDIQGTEGRLLIGNAGRELYVTKKSRRFTGFKELEQVPFPEPKNKESPFTGAARDLVGCILKGKTSKSSGEDGLMALKIITAIYDSAQKNGTKVRIR
ncbi:MAG: Gfo/Idh/MocA family oxidoreductase [Candidatus Nitronauta litoralis]|uniref:Gfo/Idh/MocA family oxidoreductase n=1 Tax=Candidatus Nitronauta litoralis TaxID=2705533 RepID=A0A7T0BWA7_9BACT|nr:MAG: Gfo/Idh/MocA family oxidoreductase [Candidatus Nitronauta litoralis]